MSEAAEVVEQVDTQPEAQEAPQKQGKPAGYDPVDLSDLPDEKRSAVENRFKYLYSQVKGNERALNEFRGIAKSQSEKIEELLTGQQAIVNHVHSTTIAETEKSLRSQMKTALEAGDTETYVNAQDKLAEIKAEKKFNEKQKTEKPKQQEQRQYNNAYEMSQEAVRDGELSQEESRVIYSWQEERDDTGGLLRPWAYAGHPDYATAIMEANAVFNSPRYSGLTMDQKISEVDKRMGVQKRTVSQNVMGGGLTQSRKQNKVSLTPKQQEIAVKTRYGGAKSDAEAIENYRKQIEKVQSKGSR